VMEGSRTVTGTAFGFALERLRTCAWDATATRRDVFAFLRSPCSALPGRRVLFSFLRSPWSRLTRRRVDFVAGRLRGRAVHAAPAVEESVRELLGGGV